jgi:CheY-like chemotaxis protein/anti-sigma regulatory factor (Ser/Thr protein kinase)
MNRMVQQVIDLTRARWSDISRQQETMIAVRTDLAVDLPPVTGVESEIREALTNLVFNAIDAMPHGGTLIFRTGLVAAPSGASEHPAMRSVEVAVGDTGGGMDEVTRRRCLEPFFTTKGELGTGMGLAMVYGVAQRHSADLEIESAVGAGTTICLRFAVSTGESEGRDKPQFTPIISERQRILLIDDDPLLLQSLRDLLEGDGHIVAVAYGGQEGIDAFFAARAHGDPFDVAITDLGMPMVNGRQVASAIKETSPATPVLLLTGWGERLVAEGEIPPNVDRVLSKPPKLRELREALAQVRRPVPQ